MTINQPSIGTLSQECTIEKPVARVRWLRRKDELVLQQYWSITTHSDEIIIGVHGEWRDVPIENDP